MINTICDHCRWRVPTSQHITLNGKSERLCSVCMNRAVERRSLEVEIERLRRLLREGTPCPSCMGKAIEKHDVERKIFGMKLRMAAQSKMYRRMEEEYERMRCLLAEITNCEDTAIEEVQS